MLDLYSLTLFFFMAEKHFNCPSCASAITPEYRFTKTVTCPYCQTPSHLSNGEITIQGEPIALADYGSIFAVGQTGKMNGEAIKVLGRIRFVYPDGVWDEWLIRKDSDMEKEYWLQEDEGGFTLFEKTIDIGEAYGKVEHSMFEVGERYPSPGGAAGNWYFCSEKNVAEVLGSEGELPYYAKPGEQANFVDGIIVGTQQVFSFEMLDFGGTGYVGSRMDISEFEMEEYTSPYA